MSAGFSSAGQGKGTQTPSPCPAPPSPLGMAGMDYFREANTNRGTYNGGRSPALRRQEGLLTLRRPFRHPSQVS